MIALHVIRYYAQKLMSSPIKYKRPCEMKPIFAAQIYISSSVFSFWVHCRAGTDG